MSLIWDQRFQSEKAMTRAYTAFGAIAVNWGPLEVSFEHILICLRVRQGLNSMHNFPGSFSSVATQVQTRLNSEPMFAHLLQPLTEIIAQCKALHDTRVVVVHGICQGQNLDEQLMFGKSKRREGWAYKSYVFSLDELEKGAAHMLALEERLPPILREIQARYLRAIDRSLIGLPAGSASSGR